MQLLSFNGQPVKSLKHLVRLADANQEEFLRFDLFRDRLVVLEAARVAEATKQICEDNSIPSPRSADLVPDVDAAAAAHNAHEGSPPLAPTVGEVIEIEAESDSVRQHPAGVNGGQPRQPSVGGAAVPARRNAAQPGNGAGGTRIAARVGQRGAERKRSSTRRGARLRSSLRAVVGTVGASASERLAGLRLGGGASSCRGRAAATRGNREPDVEGESGDRRRRRTKKGKM